MAAFEWSERYLVNVGAMDGQHKRLVGLINELDAAVSGEKGGEAVGGVLEGLIEYIQTHFDSEEKLLKEHGYPGYEDHRKMHIDLTMKVADFRRKYISKRQSVPDDLLRFLVQWLAGHIMGQDKRYGEYLNRKGIK